MTSPTQRAQLIRVSLEKLGETNGHHEFERLCLGLARQRVAPNLIPATGPVGAGGDQGATPRATGPTGRPGPS
ncbi:hypothetical protein GCM10027610_073350 [Dactylosporangium cerinum]